MNEEVLQQRLAALETENAKLKQKAEKKLTLKVTDKGCVGLYGLRRFPAAYYAQEWQVFFDMKEEIEEFIEENKDRLTWK